MDPSVDEDTATFASEDEAMAFYDEVQSKIRKLEFAIEKQDSLGSDSIEENQRIVDQIQQHLAFMNTPTVKKMCSPAEDNIVAEAESLVKSIEFLIAYKESHPDETDIKLMNLNDMTPEGLARLGIRKRSMTARHNIMRLIGEDFTQRGLMDTINTSYESRIKREMDNLMLYKMMYTRNGGNNTFQGTVTIYLELLFRGKCQVILDTVVFNLALSPLVLSVKNADTTKAMTTLLGGRAEIAKVFFNHDSPSTGAKHRQAILDSGDDLRKKTDDLENATTDLKNTLIPNEMYQNLFKDEYLNFLTEFSKPISTSIDAAIAQTYAFMALGETKRSMWILTSGMEWVFGVLSIEESGQAICQVSDIKKVEQEEDIREIMMTVLYWACTPSANVLNLYEVAPEV